MQRRRVTHEYWEFHTTPLASHEAWNRGTKKTYLCMVMIRLHTNMIMCFAILASHCFGKAFDPVHGCLVRGVTNDDDASAVAIRGNGEGLSSNSIGRNHARDTTA